MKRRGSEGMGKRKENKEGKEKKKKEEEKAEGSVSRGWKRRERGVERGERRK
ncbi:hypothetical protein ACFPC0_27755 [Streptomyces andamanensis]|uniref:Uncharacterized protein n=1 Tax=Streptomyces andamanensis TaxID=1565035 RepID=A0ABV8TLQ3_9ACTN